MRCLSLFAVLLSFGANAQNWALLNPTYKYNYSNDGSDTISNQIFVTHMDTLGPDSFVLHLNAIAEHCAPCINAPLGCDGAEGLILDRPQLHGSRASQLGGNWYLIGDDSLLVHPNAALGAQWTGPGGVEGTVTLIDEQIIFWQPDSLKTIGFSDGRSMTISKEHGILAYSADAIDNTLIGIQGGLSIGEQLPTIADLFNYQPGDILQYHAVFGGTDGICYYHNEYTRKYTVLTRTDLPGHTDYSLRMVFQRFGWGQPVWGSNDCSMYGIDDTGIDTVALGIEHDRWTADNFLGNSWLDQLWPGAYGPSGDEQIYQGDFGANDHVIQWRAYLDADQRYVFEPLHFNANLMNWEAFSTCSEDTSYRPFLYDMMMHRYVEGVGRVRASYFVFEHNGEEELTGYVIGDNTFGTILPDDILLAVGEQHSITRPVLAPNPTSDELTITGASPGSIATIVDLNGRLVLRRTIHTQPGHIDLRQLQAGVYMLSVDGSAAQRLMIIR